MAQVPVLVAERVPVEQLVEQQAASRAVLLEEEVQAARPSASVIILRAGRLRLKVEEREALELGPVRMMIARMMIDY